MSRPNVEITRTKRASEADTEYETVRRFRPMPYGSIYLFPVYDVGVLLRAGILLIVRS